MHYVKCMFFQIDATVIYYVRLVLSVRVIEKICCNDGVGLFAIGIATLKPQHLQTMTLITQHKPIERSTNTAFMTNKNSNSSLAD